MSEAEQPSGIAVVGMSGRFPGAPDLGAYWQNIADGVESIAQLSDAELRAAGVDEALLADPAYVRACPALSDVDRFDAAFFGIGAREAELMDPQHRLFLECAFEALEGAGCDPARFDGAVGVFAGSTMSTYWNTQLLGHPHASRWPGSFQALLGNDKDYLAMYTSYKLGLHGPSIGVQTACSTSLVAVHLACTSLLDSECDAALCGGVTIRVPHPAGYLSAEGSPFSPEGRCRPFDAAAQGTVFGSGVGVVVLRRLDDALADGDPILAVIRGSAVNNDGALKVGFTAPSEEGQARAIAEAVAMAEVPPETIQYIEAHGTGTPLGDPIEIAALRRVFAGVEPGTCSIGSVKGNVGHLEAAAGMAGLIKTILALRHRQLPPSINFDQANPAIDFAAGPFMVNTRLRPWPSQVHPRRAGVSSFGIGGTNAHLVVEEAPARPSRGRAQGRGQGRDQGEDQGGDPVLIPLSARTPEALQALAGSWLDWLAREPAWDHEQLLDVAYTAALRRCEHAHRLAVVADDRQSLVRELSDRATKSPAAAMEHRPSVVFVFPGSGARWRGAGRALWSAEPTFCEALKAADEALQRCGGPCVLTLLIEEPRPEEPEPGVEVMQPCLFALEVALAAQWRAWGIEPHAVVGHSLGEIAAAHVAGALTLDEAARVVVIRSRLLSRLEGLGALAVIEQPADDVRERLSGSLEIAAVNGPRATLVAGQADDVAALLARCDADGVGYWRVPVAIPFHTSLVDPLRAELRQALRGLGGRAGEVAFWSTVRGAQIPGEQLDATYWDKNLREPVAFSRTVAALAAAGHEVFVEVGPHPSLLRHVEATLGERSGSGGSAIAIPTLRSGQEHRTMLRSLGTLYERGAAVEWSRIHASAGRSCASLPSYPWQRERHWISPKPATLGRSTSRHGHPLLGERVRLAPSGDVGFWESSLSPSTPGFLADHRVQGQVVVPGAAYLEMVLATAVDHEISAPVELVDVAFTEALNLATDEPRVVQTIVDAQGLGRSRFRVVSHAPGPDDSNSSWCTHATGRVRPAAAPEAAVDLHALRERLDRALEGPAFYARLAGAGMAYGHAFQTVEQLWCGEGEALARVRATAAGGDGAAAYRFHPAVLDGCMQVLAAAVDDDTGRVVAVPSEIAELGIYARPGAELWCHARLTRSEPERLWGDIVVADRSGRVLARLRGLEVRRLETPVSAPAPRYLVSRWPEAPLDPNDPGATDAEGNWLLVAGVGGIATEVARRLRMHGGRVTVAIPGGRSGADGVLGLDPDDPSSWAAVLRSAFPAGSRPRGVVQAIGLEVPCGELDDDLDRLTTTVTLVQALLDQGLRQPPRLYLVTRNAVSVTPAEGANPGQAALWGLRRSLNIEHPELRGTCIDLEGQAGVADREVHEADARMLTAELLSSSREEEIALRRGGTRRVGRLTREPVDPSAPVTVSAGDQPYRLELEPRGTFDGLTLRACSRREPGPGEVELEVVASGLNFIDVIKTMDLYPGLAPGPVALGEEVVGRVVRRGEGVQALCVGQPVLGLAPASFGAYTTTRADLVVPRLSTLDPRAAATVPVAFLTAWYSLYELARLQPGERVLVHSAAGGTGLAAVQLAQRVGAEVLATAGTPQKREYLRSLGVTHTFDSRDGSFAAAVMAATAGEGVDVVLNSLAGDAIEQGLSVLAEDGRFLELGKRDLHAPHRRLGMEAFRRRVSFHPVDLMGLAARRPERIAAWLHAIVAAFESHELTALPLCSAPIAQVADGLQRMSQGKHIGKLVVTMDAPPPIVGAHAKLPRIRSEATYLVTGGLGGLGLVIARWLVDEGATSLVLLGRHGITTPAQADALQRIREAGASVQVVEGDVVDRETVERVLEQIAAGGSPLRGVIHAAGVLEDGVLARQPASAFRRVMAPKAVGAWNLHVATEARHAESPLDFMVYYASAVGVLGAPGQAAYAAANAFLDALAHHRRARGRHALSIDWGPFAEVGMAARGDLAEHLGRHGMKPLAPSEGPTAVAALLEADAVQAGLVPFDVRRWVEFFPALASSPRLEQLIESEVASPNAQSEAAGSLRTALMAAPAHGRTALVEDFVRSQVAAILRINAERVGLDAPLTSLGVDSLVGLELRNHLEAGAGLTFSGTLVWTYPTVASLAEHIAARLQEQPAGSAQVQPRAAYEESTEPEAQIDDDTLLTMFDAKLEALEERV